jgi:O-methyltransferase
VEPQGISSLQPDVIFVTSNFNETEICQFLESLQLSIPILPLSNLPPVPNPIDIWTWDETFQDRFNSVRPLSLLDERRAFCLDAWAQHALGCIGDFAEIGVYQGASAVLLAQRLQGTCRSLHLFDTFQGMPTADAELDLYETGSLADTTLQKVHHRLAPFEFAHLYPGIFPTTASPIEGLSFAFVHVDVDIHQSVLDCCAFFYPHMSPGGVLLFDDYGFVECAGAMEAVNTFFSGKPEHPCYLPTGQCVVVRHHAH